MKKQKTSTCAPLPVIVAVRDTSIHRFQYSYSSYACVVRHTCRSTPPEFHSNVKARPLNSTAVRFCLPSKREGCTSILHEVIYKLSVIAPARGYQHTHSTLFLVVVRLYIPRYVLRVPLCSTSSYKHIPRIPHSFAVSFMRLSEE